MIQETRLNNLSKSHFMSFNLRIFNPKYKSQRQNVSLVFTMAFYTEMQEVSVKYILYTHSGHY